MLEDKEYRTFSGSTAFYMSPQNTSCTGGTISNIYFTAPGEHDDSASYILTVDEIRSCCGFDNITQEQAEIVIQELVQLSALCYRAILNE